MPKKIVWSPLAATDFEKILSYLNESWNKQVALKFIEEIEILVLKIAEQPKQYPLANKKLKVRKCVISKHNTLFYRVSKDSIELLRIFDTRQNPRKLKL